jgi:hypothetical protein
MHEVFAFLDVHNGAIAAIATVFIALFTIVLACVSWRQTKFIGDQVKLGRDEFNATHRPEISILSFEPSYGGAEDERVAVQVMYVNNGRSIARNLRIQAKITNRNFPLQTGIGLSGPDAIALIHPDLESGKKNYFLVTSDIPVSTATIQDMAASRANPSRETPRIVCLGCVSYYDGMNGRRETAFCRIFNASSDRWEPSDNTEYEYSY